MMEYEIIYSKRKTISLKIKENGDLEIRAPVGTSKKYINDFFISKKEWIKKHRNKIVTRDKLKNQFSLNFGDNILIRGKNNIILSVEENTADYNEEKKTFYISNIATSDEIKEIVIKLYKMIAKKYIKERIDYFSKEMNVQPTGVRITSAKTRWGSCSGKNSINFSWKLIMADDETIDYVIVHELAHIKQHNHSPKFWNIVESIIPNYQVQKEKLKILGEKINKENWDLK
jgi:predicted metal-dependent hydrolase